MKTLALVSFAVLASSAIAQGPLLSTSAPAPGTGWQGTGYFNLKSNSFAEVIQAKWTTVSFLGRFAKVQLDLSGFAGFDDKYKTAVAGISLGHSWEIARTGAGPVNITAALAGSGAGQKGAFGFGGIIGIALQF